VIPVFDGVPGVACVAFMFRLERLELDGGFRVAELTGIDVGRDRFPSSGRSNPVTKLDVAVDELGQFRLELLVLGLIVILIVVVAPARSASIAAVVANPGTVVVCAGSRARLLSVLSAFSKTRSQSWTLMTRSANGQRSPDDRI
jgi:hypothetical protein